ncbi:MAG: PAS domain S-box protein [Candidatus Cloacimonadaceae bacterium]|jgi:PAS domain S-box-containing protein|nr:PAS domain S-box protein [Candidatus Cloacimonadaceae bacterium]
MAGEIILIAVDDGILAAHLQYVLTELGYDPAEPVASGEAAIAAADALTPDLILMDIHLAGKMEGITAAERIGTTSSVPVVFLTGHDEDALIQKTRAVAPYGYLVKPVSDRELAETIEMALHRYALNWRLEGSQRLLRESEERYRSLFENNHAAMLLIDPDNGAIMDANPAACAYYGWPRDVLMKRCIDEINKLTPEQTRAEMQLARAEKRNHFYFQHRLADGTVRDVEVYSSPIRLKHKDLLYSIIHDITDRKRVEAEKAELEAQNRQLQKAESLGRMAGAIAHHFNNQLQAVMGYIDLAANELGGNSGPLAFLAHAVEAAKRAAEVSHLMLIYLGQSPVQKGPVDICEVCRRSLPLLRAALPERILLEADFPFPGPIIIGNENQIQQVLTNLVTNAGEAISGGPGAIHLAVRTVQASEISLTNRIPIDWEKNDDGYVCLEVMDSGGGIAGKDIDKIFDPFFTSKFTGRGLGLPVVLGIVRAHGGVVTVQSEPGKGSIFRVFFPVFPKDVPNGLKEMDSGSRGLTVF